MLMGKDTCVLLVKFKKKQYVLFNELYNANGIRNLETYYPLQLCLVDSNMLYHNVDSALLLIGRLDVFL